MDEELHQFVHLMSLREWIGLAVVLFGSAALWGAEAVFVWRLIGMGLEGWEKGREPATPKPQAASLTPT